MESDEAKLIRKYEQLTVEELKESRIRLKVEAEKARRTLISLIKEYNLVGGMLGSGH